MAITQRQDGEVTILDLDGVLMADRGVPEFRETIRTLLEQGRTQILLNYDLLYMDDAGLDEILKAHATVTKHGGMIKLSGLTRPNRFPGLAGFNLLAVLEVHEDELKALASFRGN